MLQLQNIKKAYTTGDFTQVALNDVSVSFRDNEFVAILGPSGSGKTTLLNIIGGLDHYDSGNMIIDGISTDQYKDRDWDTFRNNRVGFVFQSYNLIPHQTVLANVELALTLSGVDAEERHARAKEALARVGLEQHINKKPSQLSGGQMQRVAIARALINDPEILLADEPTGALDSKTSVQIMDLLTEIANDRLVVMVTHNPELAEQYATRIVNLADGVITSDTDPYNPTAEEMRLSAKPIRRTSMSFLTALSLSFNNLMTKKGRTIMTAFAGSIGIIGIAAILSLATGVNDYIKSVEEETLSMYPLQITSTGFDITSMMVGSVGIVEETENPENNAGDITEAPILTRMFSSVGSNDLASLKAYFDSGESNIEQYTNSIEYSYNVTPQIYDADTSNGVRQINPDTTFSALGMGSGSYTNSIMSMSMSTDTFYEMVDNDTMVREQYDVVAGHWPENYNECLLVLTPNGAITDFAAYLLGLRDADELNDMVSQFLNEEEVVVPENEAASYTYEQLMGLQMKLVVAADRYQYDSEFDVWVDKSKDSEFMKNLIANSEDIYISGIVVPNPDSDINSLTAGIYYTHDLTEYLMERAGETQIVKDQLADTTIDVVSGKSFAALEDEEEASMGLDNMFTVDTGAIQAAFQIDESKLMEGIDGSNVNLDFSSLDINSIIANLPQFDASSYEGLPLDPIEKENMFDSDEFAAAVASAITAYVNNNAKLEPDEWLETEEGKAALESIYATLNVTNISTELSTAVKIYTGSAIGTVMQGMKDLLEPQIATMMTDSMQQLANNMSNAMNIDADAFGNAFQMNIDEEELTEVIMSMMSSDTATYESNLTKFGYADLAKPSGIDIYPADFDSKQEVINILDAYNERMEASGEEDKEITYTDIVGALMSSVTTIIDAISAVLIAFVAISLVVSSIMIGVITYISVLERKKEIGILRAIGASKGDISRVFNAETIIEGLVAGVLGVGVTALACIPASAIVYNIFDVPNVAQLPWQAAIILVLISVFLTFIAGLVPASSASRKDPVEALRSE